MKVMTSISGILLFIIFFAMSMIGFKGYMLLIFILSSLVFIVSYLHVGNKRNIFLVLEVISTVLLTLYFVLGKYGNASSNLIIRYILDSDLIFFVFIVGFPLYLVSSAAIAGTVLTHTKSVETI